TNSSSAASICRSFSGVVVAVWNTRPDLLRAGGVGKRPRPAGRRCLPAGPDGAIRSLGPRLFDVVHRRLGVLPGDPGGRLLPERVRADRRGHLVRAVEAELR